MVSWSVVSGREGSDVVFSNPNSLNTDAAVVLPGVYVLRLTVGDGAITVSDDITITVSPAPSGAGLGLTGQYFNESSLGVAIYDPRPDTDGSNRELRLGRTRSCTWRAGRDFAVRWTGRVQASCDGRSRLYNDRGRWCAVVVEQPTHHRQLGRPARNDEKQSARVSRCRRFVQHQARVLRSRGGCNRAARVELSGPSSGSDSKIAALSSHRTAEPTANRQCWRQTERSHYQGTCLSLERLLTTGCPSLQVSSPRHGAR